MKTNFKLESLTNYIIPAICFLAVIVMIPLVIMPQLTKIASDGAVIKQNKNRLATLESKAQKLKDWESKKAEIENNLSLVETVLPITKDVAALVSGIQSLARSSGLVMSSFKIQPGKTATASATVKETIAGSTGTAATPNSAVAPASSADNLVFNMSLIGDLASLKSFLHSLESGKRLLTLATLHSQSSDNSKFTIDLFLNAPFNNLPTLSKDQVGTPLAELTAENEKLMAALNSPAFVGITDQKVSPGPTCLQDPFTSKPCKP